MEKQKEIVLTTEDIEQMLNGNLFWIDVQKQLTGKETGKRLKKSDYNTENEEESGSKIDRIDSGQTWPKERPFLEVQEPIIEEQSTSPEKEKESLLLQGEEQTLLSDEHGQDLTLRLYTQEPQREWELGQGQEQGLEMELEQTYAREEVLTESKLKLDLEKDLFEQEDDEFSRGLDMLLLGMNPRNTRGRQRLEGRLVIGLISGVGLLTAVSWVYFVFYT